jgi:hypothetical protein
MIVSVGLSKLVSCVFYVMDLFAVFIILDLIFWSSFEASLAFSWIIPLYILQRSNYYSCLVLLSITNLKAFYNSYYCFLRVSIVLIYPTISEISTEGSFKGDGLSLNLLIGVPSWLFYEFFCFRVSISVFNFWIPVYN